MTTPSLHTASYNPLFDQLVAEVGPATARVTRKPSGRRAARLAADTAVAPAPRAAATRSASLHSASLRSADGLSDDEQKIVSEMGGTVARLILQMLDEAPLDRKTAALASALA